MKNNLVLSVSPHLHTRENISRIMWIVSASLIPSGIAGIFIFGINTLWVIMLGIISAVVTEALLQKVSTKILPPMKNRGQDDPDSRYKTYGIPTKSGKVGISRDKSGICRGQITVLDGSAFLTGLLLSYNLPPAVPLWIPIAGSFFAIFIGKFVFGGLGRNIFNPALAGRAFLMASWPKYMTTFLGAGTGAGPYINYDAVTSATPLAVLKQGKVLDHISYLDLFLGNRAGCIGEVCILALLVGAVFLLIKGYISWHIPVSYIFTTGLFMFIFGGNGLFKGDFVFQILSGGLILGAFYMGTDYVTSPITPKGQIIFGFGCGLLTAIIRIWGGYPEGVCYSILMMNAAVPLIDRYTRPRIYGTR